jgi:hypothetical protein
VATATRIPSGERLQGIEFSVPSVLAQFLAHTVKRIEGEENQMVLFHTAEDAPITRYRGAVEIGRCFGGNFQNLLGRSA